jgi:TIR domain
MLIQLEAQSTKPHPRSVFYSYSHKDEALRDELDTHLTLLKREEFISTWYDREIPPGDSWDQVINENLNTADVILFLVSQNFLASQYCRGIEMCRAMERSEKREAVVIPIILKPCVWTSEPFAKLQALPKNCRPLVEWPDTGFARVAEELRTMMVNLMYPRLPEEKADGQHGQWIMKLRTRPEIDNQELAQEVVSRLRQFSEDFSINLLATASTQIVDGEKLDLGLTLILTGAPEAFVLISTAHHNGRLREALDEDIVSFYAMVGATVAGSSSVGTQIDLARTEDEDLVLRPGRKIESAHMIGLVLAHEDRAGNELNFIIDTGESGRESDDSHRAEIQRISSYFYTSLIFKNELLWVNLSAYEADRMLAPELSGTEMGRNLLSQDCMLKRLTASFMHPDSPTGQEYWNAVYAEARCRFGTSKAPVRSFQKVWITASKADVYHSSTADDESAMKELTAGFPPNSNYAFLVAMELDVLCEEDLVAKKHGNATSNNIIDGDFALDLFRKIVLPKLKEEVNEGEHFAETRKIYSAEILATFLKKEQATVGNERIRNLINSGDPTGGIVVRAIAPLTIGEAIVGPNAGSNAFVKKQMPTVVDHATPNAPAFKVPENVEFYSQYVRLFKDGVFRCARSEPGDRPNEPIIRVYFSGAIDFRNLPNVIRRVRM